MVLKKIYGVLFFLFFCGAVFSQEEQLQKANEALERKAYVEAREICFKVLKKGLRSAELYEKLGDTYYFSGDFKSAAQWYKVLIGLFSKEVKPEYQERYAISLAKGGDFDKSVKSKPIVKKKNKTIKEENSIKFVTLEGEIFTRFVVDVLNINSKNSDYAPSFYNDELIFASSRNRSSFSTLIHEWNNQPFLDLYTTARGEDKKDIERLKGDINTKFHESSVTFSKDKKTVYFTRNNYSNKKFKRNKEGIVLLKIYKACYIEGKWKNIEELPFNSDEYSTAHPALSEDGRFLYFASDMPGSFGKSDLYAVEINKDGSFGKPKNLGSPINTSGRETFPYISDKGKLFFASDGHLGLGGLDIFMATPNQEGKIEVQNLGEPINSSNDDFTFIINEESNSGYFASNRKGGKGDDDIYGFRQVVSFPNNDDHKSKSKLKLERVLELRQTEEGTISLY